MNAVAIQNNLLQYPTSVSYPQRMYNAAQSLHALRNQLSQQPTESLTQCHWPSTTKVPLPTNFTHPQSHTSSVPNSFNELFFADDVQALALSEISMNSNSIYTGHRTNRISNLSQMNTGINNNHMNNIAMMTGMNPSFIDSITATTVPPAHQQNRMVRNPANYASHSLLGTNHSTIDGYACNSKMNRPLNSTQTGDVNGTTSTADINIHVINNSSSAGRLKNTAAFVGGVSFVKQPNIHVLEENIYQIPPNGNRLSFRRQDKYDKTALFKTELCTNWMLTNSCTYGNKCHFAHGVEDLKPRMRVENYKTQPCCDPAREGCRRCMYGRRCNYCHPGEAIRRSHPTPYYDKDYYRVLSKDFGEEKDFPFGIYV